MAILVTGGAGYIGSHCVKRLTELGREVVVVDNFSTGHRKSIEGARLYEGNISDKAFMDSVFSTEQIESVIHFAAFSLVGESMEKPCKYFENNTAGTLSLLESMIKHNVKNIVFSSTAAVYGEPEYIPIDEAHPKNPTNPYGESKLMIEKMLGWFDKAYGLKSIALRYFNVAGADKSGDIGEAHTTETHLIPLVLQAFMGKRDSIKMFGTDYPTADGTCVRDYIHVCDLVEAHLLALEYLKKNNQSNVFNLGNGEGFSVKEIIDVAEKTTGKAAKIILDDRRAGDPAVLIASSEKASEILGWTPAHNSISEIISDAYNWHNKHINGYN